MNRDESPDTDLTAGPLSRRHVLGLPGGAVGTAALGGAPLGAATPERTATALGPGDLDGVLTPAQTEGPYFVDARLQRRDVRRDPTTETVTEGLPLRLRILFQQVAGNTCAPLPGAFVDV